MSLVAIYILLFAIACFVFYTLFLKRKKRKTNSKKQTVKNITPPEVLTSRKVRGSPRRGNK